MKKLILSLILSCGFAYSAECPFDITRSSSNESSVTLSSITWMGPSDGLHSVVITSAFSNGGSISIYDARTAAGATISNRIFVGGGAGTYLLCHKVSSGTLTTTAGTLGAWRLNTANQRYNVLYDFDQK